MKRRGLTIVLAVLLAVLGAAGVLVYVNHANARAVAGQRAVTVLVAKQGIPSGTAAGDALRMGMIGSEVLPASSVPGDVLTSVSSDASALVTDAPVAPGEVLTSAMLVTANQATTGLAVPKGMVAVAIQFCVPEAVAGNVAPGSNVAVFSTTGTSTGGNKASMAGVPACSGQHTLTGGLTAKTTLVLPKVLVLAVGEGTGNGQATNTTTTTSTSGSNIALITLAVSTADASKLIQMSENGLPYLALVAPS